MKTNTTATLLLGVVALSLLAVHGKAPPNALQTQPARAVQTAASPVAQFIAARSGSIMRLKGRVDGIHCPWLAQSKIIQGQLEVGPDFPVAPGQAVTPGPVVAAADVYIPVTCTQNED